MNLQDKINQRIQELEASIEIIRSRYKNKDKSDLEVRVEYLEDVSDSVLGCIIDIKQLLNN